MTDTQIKPMSLRKNFSWTFTGNAIYAACQWGMLMAMAKLGTPTVVGQYTLGLAITAPVFMLTNLQLRAVQATDAKDDYSFGDYLGLRISGSAFAIAIILLVILFGGYRGETAIVIILLGLAKFIESVSDICFGLVQKHEHMQLIAKSHILKGILSLVALIVILIVTRSIVLSIVGLIISWFMVLVFYDLINTRSFSEPHPVFDSRKLWPLVRLSLPLGAVMALISLNTNIPRYFIEHELSVEALGYFSAMAYLIVAGNTVVGALGQSASPRLAKYYANHKPRAFINLIKKMMCIGVAFGAIGVILALFAGQSILTVLYGVDYARYTNVFVLLMFASGFGYISSFLGYGITAARFFRVQVPLNIIYIAITLIGSVLLIPSKGLMGAAWVNCITLFLQIPLKCLVLFNALKCYENFGGRFKN